MRLVRSLLACENLFGSSAAPQPTCRRPTRGARTPGCALPSAGRRRMAAAAAAAAAGGSQASAPAAGGSQASAPAALVWFRNDLRLADHEPLYTAARDLQAAAAAGAAAGSAVRQRLQEAGQHHPLLLPFFCLDNHELGAGLSGGPDVPQAHRLGIPLLGPHRLRLVLEGCAGLQAALRGQYGSDLLWALGRPEELVGRLVALAACQGSTHVALYHYMQPGRRSADLEDAVAEAFGAAAAQHGLPSSVHRSWGATLYHPDDLPYHLYRQAGSSSAAGHASGTSTKPDAGVAAGEAAAGAAAAADATQPCSRVHRQQERYACLPRVMTDFRKVLQAHTAVRLPLPAPLPAAAPADGDYSGNCSSSNSKGIGSSSSGGIRSIPALPPLPADVAAAAAAAGLLEKMPTRLAAVYAAAGPAAAAALARWEALTGQRCALLAPAGSGRHDSRSAVPFTMGEQQAVQRLRYLLGLEESNGHNVLSTGQAPPILSYQQSRMEAWGVDNSAKLSAFMSLGCLSPRTVHAEVMHLAAAQQAQQQQAAERQPQQQAQAAKLTCVAPAVASSAGATAPLSSPSPPAWQEAQQGDTWRWLLMHLAIRDFFLFNALKEGDALERPEGLSGAAVLWKQDEALFQRWASGLPFVDACMRELAATGYMSNRGRQNVANLLSKALGLDWRLGAEYFESLLADADWAVNLGNWSYNAGTGNDPRDRRFMTITQGLRYDPEGHLVAAWVPELAGLLSWRPPGDIADLDSANHPSGVQLMHQPWLAPPEALAAAGVRLGDRPTLAAVAAGRGQRAAAAATAEAPNAGSPDGFQWYPLPVLDPASQTGKGPKPKQQQKQAPKQLPALSGQ